MDRFREKVRSQFRRGLIGGNISCDYYPCHHYGQNCTHCFCPFYPCGDGELGKYVKGNDGRDVWSCQHCYWIHRDEVAKECIERFGDRDWASLTTDELQEIKREIEKKHFKFARPLMVLGTSSGAGKSLMVAALCRIFSDLGFAVTPFKSQNMSLNSFVTTNGEEIARIQGLQARAARREPVSQMNPILLKPIKDDVSQVIVHGVPYKDMDVRTYYNEFVQDEGMGILERSLDFLKRTNDIIIMEGAGSPAEINIGDFDIANLKAAKMADAPCILVANIERGGVFAYLYGTIKILEKEWQEMFKGAVINNMRGDASHLGPGMEKIEEMTGVPMLGVVPHMELDLPSEDSMDIRDRKGDARYTAGVIRLPRISNFTDFDALGLLEDISVKYLNHPTEAQDVDVLIIPGTKSTIEDLKWVRETGFDKVIRDICGKIPIFGICGGYQMLGKTIIDTNSIESDETETEGLGLLDGVTYFEKYEKRTTQVEGHLRTDPLKRRIRGYEIHMGRTLSGKDPPLNRVRVEGKYKDEGAYDPKNKVFGTYIHGFFDLPPARELLISTIDPGGKRPESANERCNVDAITEMNLDKLAAVVKNSIDIELLKDIMGV